MDDGSTPYLAVVKSGTGKGLVTDSEGKINCGSVCTFSSGFGTRITLSGRADQSSVFTGWSGGGCTGTGDCTIILDSDKVTVPTFVGPAVTAREPDVTISDIATNEFSSPGPTHFNQHTSVGFTATNVVDAASFSVFFQFLPEYPVFFKVVGSNWKQIYPINECGGVTDISLTGTTLSYTMAVNSECNSNRDVPKTIVDPLVVGSMSGGDDGHCFIATAAYGSYLHPTVRVFRSFRDTFLLSNPTGRSFVAWYYRVSPPLAEAVRANDFMGAGVRVCLLPLAGFSLLCLKIGFFPMITILLAFIVIFLWKRWGVLMKEKVSLINLQ